MVQGFNPLPQQGKGLLFQSVAGVGGLAAGWMRVLARAGAPGRDGESVAHFARGAERRIATLSRELLSGLYRPHRPRVVSLPKPSGGVRVLRVPSVRDRIVQTSATLVLTPILEPTFEDASFGYRPGRSIQAAARRILAHRASGLTFVVEADVADFFDSVPHAGLLAKLAVHVKDEDLLALVRLWLESAEPDGVGIAQGSPLSPLLANLYLDAMDEALSGADTALVRYADDFVILCRSPLHADAALRSASAHLAAHHLTLHADKTRIVPFEEGFRFLGHSFGAHGALYESAPARPELVEQRPAPPAAPPAPAVAGNPATPLLPTSLIGDEPKAPARLAPRLRKLYLHGAGVRLTVAGEAFRVESAGETLADVPPLQLDRVEIGPDAEVTARALRHAFTYGIGVDFVDGRGGALGHADPPYGRRARRHLAQASLRLDAAGQLAVAKAIIAGRIHNQRALLSRLNRRRKSPILAAAGPALGRTLRKVLHAESVDQARGHEGEAARLYWPAYGSCFGDFAFVKRQRGGEADPPNLVLDVLSGLLQRELRALAQQAELHPAFGFLHVQEGGDFCVGADLVEEFRAPIAEALTAYLFSNRFLGPEDFSPLPAGTAARWRIGEVGLHTVIRQYEAYLDREVRSPRTGEASTWRGVMEDQVRHFADVVDDFAAGGSEIYTPYKMDY